RDRARSCAGPGNARLQDSRRASQCSRPSEKRGHQFHHQQSERQNSARRRGHDSQRRHRAENSDHDDLARGSGQCLRDPFAPKERTESPITARISREKIELRYGAEMKTIFLTLLSSKVALVTKSKRSLTIIRMSAG